MAATTAELKRILLLCGLAVLLLPAAAVWAQEQDAATRIVINSTRLRTVDLPPAGYSVRIRVELLNSPVIQEGLRAALVLDGDFIEVPVQGGRFNDRYLPEYFIEFPAPRRSLSWEFMLPQGDGGVIRSERYSAQRHCELEESLLDLKEHWRVAGDELIGISLNRAEKLERELATYEQSIDLTRKLRQELGVTP